jgi:hypothetical protein
MKTHKTQSVDVEKTQYVEPKRLSKFGQWRRDNPGGIFIKVKKSSSKKHTNDVFN